MFKEILLPVDLGDESSSMKAVAEAIELAKGGAAKLHLLAVVPGYSMSIISQYFPADFEQKSLADATARLRQFIAANIPADISSQAIVANGTVYEEILKAAKDIHCDLVVIASHRPELKDYLLGQNAARVVRHADCSVLVVRD